MFFFFFFFSPFHIRIIYRHIQVIYANSQSCKNRFFFFVFFFFFCFFCFFFAGFGVYFFLYVSNGTGLIVWTGSRTFHPNWIDEKHCFDSLLRVDT